MRSWGDVHATKSAHSKNPQKRMHKNLMVLVILVKVDGRRKNVLEDYQCCNRASQTLNQWSEHTNATNTHVDEENWVTEIHKTVKADKTSSPGGGEEIWLFRCTEFGNLKVCPVALTVLNMFYGKRWIKWRRETPQMDAYLRRYACHKIRT